MYLGFNNILLVHKTCSLNIFVMDNFLKALLFIFVIIFLENVNAQTEIDLSNTIPLESQELGALNEFLISPYRMEFILNSKYLAITDLDNQPSLHIIDFSNKDNYKYVTGLGKQGRGPSEYLSPNVIIDVTDEEAFYVHDANGMKLVKYDSEFNPLPNEELTIRPNGLPITMHLFNDQFIANGITVNAKFELLGKDGSSINGVGEPISLGSGLPPHVIAQAWHSYSTLSSNKGRVAIFSRSADRAELYDLSTEQKVGEFIDQRFPQPDLRIVDTGNNARAVPGRNAKIAFSWATSNNNFIYALYSGESVQSETSNYGKYILVFDWDLNLLGTYELDHHSFTILANNDGDIFSIQNDPIPAIHYISSEDFLK